MAKYDHVEGYIHSVESLSAHDGPGLRYVVFFQGCPFRCLYCHNPDTRDFAKGQRITAEEQMRDVLRYRKYISGGVTLSGGEPLAQPEFATALAKLAAQNGLHCAIDTSGGIPLNDSKQAVDAADLMIIDIKSFSGQAMFETPCFDMRHTWDLLEYCQSSDKKVWVRYVVVPGLTVEVEKYGENILNQSIFVEMNSELVEGIDRIKKMKCVEKIEFLPFHTMGEHKWNALGLTYALKDIDVPSADVLAWCQALI